MSTFKSISSLVTVTACSAILFLYSSCSYAGSNNYMGETADFNALVLGESGVGKTKFINSLVDPQKSFLSGINAFTASNEFSLHRIPREKYNIVLLDSPDFTTEVFEKAFLAQKKMCNERLYSAILTVLEYKPRYDKILDNYLELITRHGLSKTEKNIIIVISTDNESYDEADKKIRSAKELFIKNKIENEILAFPLLDHRTYKERESLFNLIRKMEPVEVKIWSSILKKIEGNVKAKESMKEGINQLIETNKLKREYEEKYYRHNAYYGENHCSNNTYNSGPYYNSSPCSDLSKKILLHVERLVSMECPFSEELKKELSSIKKNIERYIYLDYGWVLKKGFSNNFSSNWGLGWPIFYIRLVDKHNTSSIIMEHLAELEKDTKWTESFSTGQIPTCCTIKPIDSFINKKERNEDYPKSADKQKNCETESIKLQQNYNQQVILALQKILELKFLPYYWHDKSRKLTQGNAQHYYTSSNKNLNNLGPLKDDLLEALTRVKKDPSFVYLYCYFDYNWNQIQKQYTVEFGTNYGRIEHGKCGFCVKREDNTGFSFAGYDHKDFFEKVKIGGEDKLNVANGEASHNTFLVAAGKGADKVKASHPELFESLTLGNQKDEKSEHQSSEAKKNEQNEQNENIEHNKRVISTIEKILKLPFLPERWKPIYSDNQEECSLKNKLECFLERAKNDETLIYFYCYFDSYFSPRNYKFCIPYPNNSNSSPKICGTFGLCLRREDNTGPTEYGKYYKEKFEKVVVGQQEKSHVSLDPYYSVTTFLCAAGKNSELVESCLDLDGNICCKHDHINVRS